MDVGLEIKTDSKNTVLKNRKNLIFITALFHRSAT